MAGAVLVAGTAVLGIASTARAATTGFELLDASLRARVEWAQGFRAVQGEGHRPHKAELRLEPRAEIGLPLDFRATVEARLRVTPFDRLDPDARSGRELWAATRPRLLGNLVEIELRQAVLEGDIGPFAVSLGKQSIAWGIADRIPLLDVLAPFDFREFVLPELEDYRIPLWSALVGTRIGPVDVELAWTPDPSVSVVPERDGLFALRSPQFVPVLEGAGLGIPIVVERPRHPGSGPRNWDGGARVATFAAGWDLAAYVLHRIDDRPVFQITRQLGAGGATTALRVRPRNRRVQHYGVTATRAFGDLTLRSELAFVDGRSFTAQGLEAALGSRRGIEQADEFEAVVGLDWFGFRGTLVTAQVYPRWLANQPSHLARDRLETDVTLRAERSFRNDTIELGVQWIHNLNRGDGLVQPSAAIQWNDQLRLRLGVDVFYGTKRGVFGQYDALDRVVLGVELRS